MNMLGKVYYDKQSIYLVKENGPKEHGISFLAFTWPSFKTKMPMLFTDYIISHNWLKIFAKKGIAPTKSQKEFLIKGIFLWNLWAK
jgi:hypothetical protein